MADIAFAHSTSPYTSVYPWAAGFGVKYANPATLLGNNGRAVRFSAAGTDIAFGTLSTPFVGAYPWTVGVGFGAKYANPATLPVNNVNGVAFSPSGADLVTTHLSNPFTSAYPWSAGFGVKYANPVTLPSSSGDGVRFSPSGADLAISHTSGANISVYPWNAGFGAKYANPATPPEATGTDVAFSPSGADIAISNDIFIAPAISVYPWNAGFGAKYANPATPPTGKGLSVLFSPSGADIVIGHELSPFVSAYPWAAGFGVKYANPATAPAGDGNDVSFLSSGADVAVGHITTPFVSAYPWAAGFGVKYANPATLPTGDVRGVHFLQDIIATQVATRHYQDEIMLALFQAEAAYGTPTATWSTTTACGMQDFDDNSPHESWDDLVEDDDLLVHNVEYPTVQQIVRQGVRFTYTEPRVKPNTLAGLLGLALGTLTTVQDGALIAYRHAITPSNPLNLKSISAQIAHMRSSQYRYAGLKADGFTLRNNGPYLTLEVPIIGSGKRETSTTTFLAAIAERWLRWGDCRLYLKDVTGAPLSVPAAPVQGSTNLGANAIDISTRVLRMELMHPNTLLAERGYQASTGVLRGSLLTAKRRTDVRLELQVDTANEARDLDFYLKQTQLAFEWQCKSTQVIAATGTMFFGATVILPRLQLRAMARGEQDEFDTLICEGRVLDDRVNAVFFAWVYTAQPTYLA